MGGRPHGFMRPHNMGGTMMDDEEDDLYYKIRQEGSDGSVVSGNGREGNTRGLLRGGSEAVAFASSSSQLSTQAEEFSSSSSSSSSFSSPNRDDGNMEAMAKPRGKRAPSNNRGAKLPRIGNTDPPRGSAVRDAQTFSARVLPSKSTNSPVRSVHFVLTDQDGNESGPLELSSSSGGVGGSGLYEITIDGFGTYGGSTWSYAVVARDENGKRRSTDEITFDIVTSGDLGGGDADGAPPPPSPPPPAPPSSSPGGGGPAAEPIPKKYETDSDWTRGGAVQSTTGRILFEFDGSGQTYVCSGTVVHDGPRGTRPDVGNGRSIVQTAAHCAYSDVLKKFATKAVFVPDQDSTRGKESDFDCNNDRYGCWHLSYAVVAEGWTIAGFPDNVPYDYAYYVSYDDPAGHAGGYETGLSGSLDADVGSMRIDFDADVDDDEFVFSVGYSADKDPSLRHCAMERTSINGVEWYENYWLDNCAMTGGASGGPWLVDVDSDGVGTLVSVNSWGFAHRIGMAGPNLRTGSGSMAECLYDKAKESRDPGSEGGYIVTPDSC